MPVLPAIDPTWLRTEVGGGGRSLCAFMNHELVDAWCRDIEQRRLVMEAHDAYKNWERMSAWTYA